MLINSNLYAAGLYLSEVASPGSLKTAGVANVTNNWGIDSASTNPAGMTGLKRDQVMGGMQIIAPNSKFDFSIAEAGGNDGGNAGVTALIPGVYAVKTLGDRFRFGLSIAAPLGGGVDYRDNFVGRYQIINAEIAGAFISLSFAYKISNKLSVGAGVSMIYTLLDKVKIDFDLLQLINVGLKYDVTDDLKLFMSLDWEDWSEFSDNRLNIEGGAAATPQSLDRNFKDTYHAGVGLAYDFGGAQRIVVGVRYDSSPADDKDRTADMPFDEQVQFSVGWGSRGNGSWAMQ